MVGFKPSDHGLKADEHQSAFSAAAFFKFIRYKTNESNPHCVEFRGRSKRYLTGVKYSQIQVFLTAIGHQKDRLYGYNWSKRHDLLGTLNSAQ